MGVGLHSKDLYITDIRWELHQPRVKQRKISKEIVKDKVVGHDRNRYGGGGGHYRYGGLGGFHSSHTSDQPFIRYWVEERYICQKCGRHISIHTRKDMR